MSYVKKLCGRDLALYERQYHTIGHIVYEKSYSLKLEFICHERFGKLDSIREHLEMFSLIRKNLAFFFSLVPHLLSYCLLEK